MPRMQRLLSGELFVGQTAKQGRFKIYLVGSADETNDRYWLETGSRNTKPFDSSLPDQRTGFDTIDEALAFARELVATCNGERHLVSKHKGRGAKLVGDDKEPKLLGTVSQYLS